MLYRGLFFVAMVMANLCFGAESEEKGRILVFTGTTTAGKTSAALQFKKQLEAVSPHNVEIFAIDSYFIPKVKWAWGLNRANPFNAWTANSDLIKPEQMENIIIESRQALCDAAKTAAYVQGKTVVIDCPVYTAEKVAAYKQALEGYNVSWILAYCDLPTLVNRVIKRNDDAVAKGQADEQRSLAQALNQFEGLYTSKTTCPIGILSPGSVNSTCDSAQIQHVEMQKKISDTLRGVQNAMCPLSIEEIKKLMMIKWGAGATAVGPVVEHDFVVDTGRHSAEECARQIIEKFYPELVS